MLPVDILGCDIISPCAATQGERKGHSIIIITAISITLWLIDHNSADWCFFSQKPYSVFTCGVNATAMSGTVISCDILNLVYGFFKILIFPQCDYNGKFFSGEGIRWTNCLAMNHQERFSLWQVNPSDFSNLLCALGNNLLI